MTDNKSHVIEFDVPLVKKPVKFCGHDLFIQEWDGVTRAEWEHYISKNPSTVYAYTAFISLVDADGNRVGDLKNLCSPKVPSKELFKVWKIANKLNKMEEDVEKN